MVCRMEGPLVQAASEEAMGLPCSLHYDFPGAFGKVYNRKNVGSDRKTVGCVILLGFSVRNLHT